MVAGSSKGQRRIEVGRRGGRRRAGLGLRLAGVGGGGRGRRWPVAGAVVPVRPAPRQAQRAAAAGRGRARRRVGRGPRVALVVGTQAVRRPAGRKNKTYIFLYYTCLESRLLLF